VTIQNNLSGKTALVTGASRGIGRATALTLAQAGAQVSVHYSTGEKEATGVVTDIRNAGGKADKIAADLRTADGPHHLAELVRAIVGERLDILVANAGIAVPSPIEETTVDDFDKLFAVNVRAPYFLVQQLLPIMEKGSSVMLLSSLAARAVVGNLSAYAATKGAIDTLVKHFASALGDPGHSSQRGSPGRRPDRDVELQQDGRGTGFHLGDSGTQANVHARRNRGGDRLPRIRSVSVDHR
jgi:3-oxoacyl-[acyl-carrier protein] reductase